MELGVRERFVLLNLLPQEGNVLLLKIVRKFREDLSLSAQEIKEFGVRFEGAQVFWEQDKEVPKKVSVSDPVKSMVTKVLMDLDKKEKLKEEHLLVYDKFVLSQN